MKDEKEMNEVNEKELEDVNGGAMYDFPETANGSPRGMFTEAQLKQCAEAYKELLEKQK